MRGRENPRSVRRHQSLQLVVDVPVPPAGGHDSVDFAGRVLPEEIQVIIDETGAGGAIPTCGCGHPIGHVLDEVDGDPVVTWGPYAIWSVQPGVYRILCGECTHRQSPTHATII